MVLVGSPPSGRMADPRVTWLTRVSDAELRWLYANARAVVSISYEDFGLTPVEGYAFGTPAALLRAGGFLETMKPGVTGQFIEAPTATAVARTLSAFPAFSPQLVRAHSQAFSEARFAARLHAVVDEVVNGSTE